MFVRSRYIEAVLLLVALLAGAGCGQTGPLYMPEPEVQAPRDANVE